MLLSILLCTNHFQLFCFPHNWLTPLDTYQVTVKMFQVFLISSSSSATILHWQTWCLRLQHQVTIIQCYCFCYCFCFCYCLQWVTRRRRRQCWSWSWSPRDTDLTTSLLFVRQLGMFYFWCRNLIHPLLHQHYNNVTMHNHGGKKGQHEWMCCVLNKVQ